MADAAALKQLAPTGKLRLAIAVSPSPSAQFAIQDGSTYRGVAVTLGRALAAKLGVPLEIIPHQASGEIQNSAASNRWDVAFLPVDDERKKFVDFGNAYHLLQSTFLVRPGSKVQSVKDADAAASALVASPIPRLSVPPGRRRPMPHISNFPASTPRSRP